MADQQRNPACSIYVGNLDERVNESLLWELMLQAGPVGMCIVISKKIITHHVSQCTYAKR